MEQWEIEEQQFLQAQEEEERQQREVEETLEWHLKFTGQPGNDNER